MKCKCPTPFAHILIHVKPENREEGGDHTCLRSQRRSCWAQVHSGAETGSLALYQPAASGVFGRRTYTFKNWGSSFASSLLTVRMINNNKKKHLKSSEVPGFLKDSTLEWTWKLQREWSKGKRKSSVNSRGLLLRRSTVLLQKAPLFPDQEHIVGAELVFYASLQLKIPWFLVFSSDLKVHPLSTEVIS